MKLRIGLLAATGLLALTTTQAQAQAARGWEVGVEGYTYRYEENLDDLHIEDEGRLFGLSVEYGREFARDWVFDARLRVAFGEVDYSASDGARISDVEQSEGQLELTLGRAFAASASTTVTPYAGIGARVFNDYLGGREAQTGQLGYDREISYSYVPLGVVASTTHGGRTLSFYGQYNWLVGGTSRSEFGDIDPELPTIEVEFENGHGWELGAKLSTPLGRGSFGIQPFIRLWDLDRSTSFIASDEEFELELYEPPNTTRELGVRLTYGF